MSPVLEAGAVEVDDTTAAAFDLGLLQGPAGMEPEYSSEDCTNTCHTQPACKSPGSAPE
jgi:hypothetical protein